jgi:hypothetical protein
MRADIAGHWELRWSVRRSICVRRDSDLRTPIQMPPAPTTLDEAKALVAGALGMQMEKYPLRFAAPAFFGAPPDPGQPMSVSSGSASLLRHEGKAVALTCQHVLESYRKKLEAAPATIFQLGNCKLDPQAQLRTEDEELDYAVIDLTEPQVQEIVQGTGEFGRHFVEPGAWPPASVTEGEFVTFGGFPGELRMTTSFEELSFGSYSSGASRVTTVRDSYIVCQFERERWVKHEFEPEPATIRGMSGGPVFAMRKSPESGIITYEFIGHIFEFSEDFELLYVRLVSALAQSIAAPGTD